MLGKSVLRLCQVFVRESELDSVKPFALSSSSVNTSPSQVLHQTPTAVNSSE